MQRIIGAMILLLGCIGWAKLYCERNRLRTSTLRDMEHMVRDVWVLVEERKLPLPDILKEMSNHLRMPFNECIGEVVRQYESGEDRGLITNVKEKLKLLLDSLPLEDREKDCLNGMWDIFDIGFMEDGLVELQRIADRLHTYAQNAEEQDQKKNRLAMKIGMMSGLLLILVFWQ